MLSSLNYPQLQLTLESTSQSHSQKLESLDFPASQKHVQQTFCVLAKERCRSFEPYSRSAEQLASNPRKLFLLAKTPITSTYCRPNEAHTLSTGPLTGQNNTSGSIAFRRARVTLSGADAKKKNAGSLSTPSSLLHTTHGDHIVFPCTVFLPVPIGGARVQIGALHRFELSEKQFLTADGQHQRTRKTIHMDRQTRVNEATLTATKKSFRGRRFSLPCHWCR